MEVVNTVGRRKAAVARGFVEPGEGGVTGAAALTPLGASPQTPFLIMIEVFR